MQEVSVRPASWHDAAAVEELWCRLLEEQAALEELFTPAEDARRRWRNDFALWVRDRVYRIYVADRQGEVVGIHSRKTSLRILVSIKKASCPCGECST